ERGDVAVGAEAEQEQVGLGAVELPVVLVRGVRGRELAADPVHSAGLALEPVEERALREPVVRALVAGRDAALVAPPELDAAPVAPELRGLLVRPADRRAARQ